MKIPANATNTAAQTTHKYLIMETGEARAGVDIQSVRRIIEYQLLQFVPGLPEFCLGVLNLEGISIPVVDLQHRLGLGACTIHARTGIVIVQTEADNPTALAGLLVDAVSHVAELDQANMLEVPEMALRDHCNAAISPTENAIILHPESILIEAPVAVANDENHALPTREAG